jgi:hypothetical protein
MKTIERIYINGEFVTPHGTETFDLISPTDNTQIGTVRLADQEDTRAAIAAAKQALKHIRKRPLLKGLYTCSACMTQSSAVRTTLSKRCC